MSDFLKTDIGRFPASWPIQPLGTLFETQLGKMLSQKARGGNAPKQYLRNKNVQWGHIDTSDMLEMDFSSREMEKFRLRVGDLLVCEGGEPGRAAIWQGQVDECYYQKALHRLRPIDGQMCSEFFAHWLRFSLQLENLYGVAGASSTIAHLPEVQLVSLPIPVPPLHEQRKIAAVLGLVQRAIEQQARLLALTTELKKALLHKLFTEGLRGEPRKQTELGLVPESWEVVKLGDLFDTQLGKMLSQKARTGDDPKPYLRNKNVQWGAIDITDLLSMDFNERERGKFILVPGDLLICEGGEPGRAAIWRGAMTECYYQKALHRLRPKSDTISNEFLAHWLEFALRYQDLYGVAGASSTIAHLPEVQLKMLQIPLPSRNEQDMMVESFNAVDNKIALHQSKHAAFTAMFRTLLHQFMTAQIRVHDLILPELETVTQG